MATNTAKRGGNWKRPQTIQIGDKVTWRRTDHDGYPEYLDGRVVKLLAGSRVSVRVRQRDGSKIVCRVLRSSLTVAPRGPLHYLSQKGDTGQLSFPQAIRLLLAGCWQEMQARRELWRDYDTSRLTEVMSAAAQALAVHTIHHHWAEWQWDRTEAAFERKHHRGSERDETPSEEDWLATGRRKAARELREIGNPILAAMADALLAQDYSELPELVW